MKPGGHAAIKALEMVLGGENDEVRVSRYTISANAAAIKRILFIYIYLRI